MAVVDINALHKMIKYAEAEANACGLSLTAHLLQLAASSIEAREMILQDSIEMEDDGLSRFGTSRGATSAEISAKQKLQ